MFIGHGALPLVGDGCVEIFQLDIVGKVHPHGKGSGLHVAITALRHVAEGHQYRSRGSCKGGRWESRNQATRTTSPFLQSPDPQEQIRANL